MRVDIRRAPKDYGTKAKELVERRTRFALERFGVHVTTVRWFFQDVNGPRGGIDLQCKAVAKIASGGEVVVEDRDGRLDPLIDRVAERMGLVVARRLERKRLGDTCMAYDGSVRR
jgi:putative sigma-54 modulation protein